MPIDIVRVTRQMPADVDADDSEAQVALAEATAADAKEAVNERLGVLVAEGVTTRDAAEVVIGDPTWDDYGERGRRRCTIQAHIDYAD